MLAIQSKSLNRIIRFAAAVVILFGVCPLAHAQTMDAERLKTNLDIVREKSALRMSTDSLKVILWSDSLTSKINKGFHSDSLNLSNRIDSLRNLRLPTDKLTTRLDSLRSKRDNLVSEVNEKRTQLISATQSRVDKWRSAIEEKISTGSPVGNKLTEIDPVTGKISEGISGLNDELSISSLSIPDLEGLNENIPGIDIPDLPELSTESFKDLGLSPDLADINEELNLDALDKVQNIQSGLGIDEGLGSLQGIQDNPDLAIESAVERIDEIGALKEELQGVDVLKQNEAVELAQKLQDPAAVQEELKEMAVQKAVDHFAGKEAVLQEAMNKLAKYKAKYESLSSLSDIKKLPKNVMKGKSFRERFLPGVALQFLKNENLLLDVNPYAGYRITGRLTGGLGWNQRIGYSLDEHYFTSASEIYGPRFYSEVRTWRGFIVRGEFEVMNTEVPASISRVAVGEGGREWVRTAFVGIKRDYRFFKSVKGTAFLMFSVYNDHRKSPYGDVVNSRFGFEFPMKKKERGQ